MSVNVDLVGVAYVLTGLGLVVFFQKPLQYPDKPGSRAFLLTLVGCMLWPLSVGMTHLIDVVLIDLVGASGRIVAPSIISVGWFLFALSVTRSGTSSPWLVRALASYLCLDVAVVATNAFHGLALDPDILVGGSPLEPAFGPWFWAQATINYGLIATATLILAVHAVRSSGLRRRQAAVLSLATVPPLLANLVTIAGFADVPHDLTPFGLVGSGGVLSWALYRADLLRVVPVARQSAVEKMDDAVVTLDDHQRIVDCNAEARRLFDVDSAYFGRPSRDVFASLSADVRTAIEAGETADVNLSIETSDGVRHFDCLTSTVGRDESATEGRVVVLRDVTERKRYEQRLLQQNETLDEFVSIVSHDVQGLLMRIRGNANLAANTGEVEHIEPVLDATDRMDQLVEDLHELARTGQQIGAPEPVELAVIVREAWETTWTGDADLVADVDGTILADPARLQQLLENCFRNAIEHGESTIRVSVESIPGGFAIEDDGPGIPSDVRDSVFDRGFTTADDGTGLGLAITAQIASAHGWTIEAVEGVRGGARLEISAVDSP